MDTDVIQASRSWGDGWLVLRDGRGNSLGDAYEVHDDSVFPMQSVAARPLSPGQAPAAFRPVEVVVRDTGQSRLLSIIRSGPHQAVSISGPDGQAAGTASLLKERSRWAIEVVVAARLALQIFPANHDRKSRGERLFTVLAPDNACVATLKLLWNIDHSQSQASPPGLPISPQRTAVIRPTLPTAGRGLPPIRFQVSLSILQAQAPPVSGMLGALPIVLFPLMLPTLEMMSIALPSLSGLGKAALGGLAGALLEGLAEAGLDS